jgi:hypothetical protein
LDIRFKIHSKDFDKELKEFGCLVNNCVNLVWKSQLFTQLLKATPAEDAMTGGKTFMFYFMLSNEVIIN